MASLSLPRVFQIKRNSLDAEREQFEKFQTLAIQKAINTIETPVKEKHVRSTIIGTFQEQSAITYWMVAIRQPLQDNRIAAWKFCHVTHKLLREGHPACLDDSQRHITMIENLGKLWVHLREGYGRLVNLYCALLVCKLRFHARNPRFPGNMQLTSDELDAIAENDVNNYFQLCVELFDYMDDILNLQASVFDSLGNARANSMTASGQCRLAGLIPCAQDSSQIYDCNVRLLFRLHAALPADTLAGHRERFRQQFKKLSSFYKHASSLQYYRNLLTLPLLPSNPPNFLIQSDFGTYVAPVVSIPEPPPDETDSVGALIDTSSSDIFSQSNSDHLDVTDSRTTPSPQLEQIAEQDRHIEHLTDELRRTRELHQMEMQHLVQERGSMLQSMRDHCTHLENQMQTMQRELEIERQKAAMLAAQTPEMTKKLSDVEEKARTTDEKFQKLKGAYTQLREEHIGLIRQKAEVDKATASLRVEAAQHESAKMLLQQQLNDRIKDVELLQQSASSSEEIDAYKNEISILRTDLERALQKEAELEALKATIAVFEIEHKTAIDESEAKLLLSVNEVKELSENIEHMKKDKEEREIELVRVKEELTGLKESSEEQYHKAVDEKEAALQQIVVLTEQHRKEKQELVTEIEYLKENLILSKNTCETITNEKDEISTRLNSELHILNTKLDQTTIEKETEIQKLLDVIHNNDIEYEKHIKEINDEIDKKQHKLQELQIQLDDTVQNKNSEIEKLIAGIAERDEQKKSLEEKMERGTAERLKVECELQDLLQHNTDLEEKLSLVTKQLEESKLEIVKQRSDVVSCASDVASEVLVGALAALERGNSHESGRVAGDHAATELTTLAGHTEVCGKESSVGRALVLAAHGSAQLAAYVTDVANVATDVEVADKLTSDCRTMLATTKQCAESLKEGDGAWSTRADEARRSVEAVSRAAVAADKQVTVTRSVDDELADMDSAVEQAANRIEEMLAASRAADTGAKLEVNAAILDACTSLMGAVRALVREARALQAELGDPATRHRVYRRNPQWAQGLVSAAKAVVFAAKLLVTSADEAVGAAGRVEGVSAAAHEVAGSTAQLVAASRSRAPPAAPALARLTAASRAVASATGAVVAAVRAASALQNEHEALDTSALTLTATRRLEMESKVRALELESALEAERVRLAALRKRHYHLAQMEENGTMTNGQQ